ncbi:MAG: hypothetical protein JST91_25145 [Actinobacteria bacterium]|nr:hypothetical protein [Actinomycetota bacterium]
MDTTPSVTTTRRGPHSLCRRCGAERPAWLGTAHRCVGDANLSWLDYYQMNAQTALAWRRQLLQRDDRADDGAAETPLAS